MTLIDSILSRIDLLELNLKRLKLLLNLISVCDYPTGEEVVKVRDLLSSSTCSVGSEIAKTRDLLAGAKYIYDMVFQDSSKPNSYIIKQVAEMRDGKPFIMSIFDLKGRTPSPFTVGPFIPYKEVEGNGVLETHYIALKAGAGYEVGDLLILTKLYVNHGTLLEVLWSKADTAELIPPPLLEKLR